MRQRRRAIEKATSCGGAFAPTWRWRDLWGSGSGAVFEPPAGVAGLDDVAVVRQPIEHGGCHFCVAEHLRPIGKGEIGGDQQRGVLVELADQVEQQLAPGWLNGR